MLGEDQVGIGGVLDRRGFGHDVAFDRARRRRIDGHRPVRTVGDADFQPRGVFAGGHHDVEIGSVLAQRHAFARTAAVHHQVVGAGRTRLARYEDFISCIVGPERGVARDRGARTVLDEDRIDRRRAFQRQFQHAAHVAQPDVHVALLFVDARRFAVHRHRIAAERAGTGMELRQRQFEIGGLFRLLEEIAGRGEHRFVAVGFGDFGHGGRSVFEQEDFVGRAVDVDHVARLELHPQGVVQFGARVGSGVEAQRNVFHRSGSSLPAGLFGGFGTPR